jgi:hypothetical protein
MPEVVGHVGTLHAGGAIIVASSEDAVDKLCQPELVSVANDVLLRNMLNRKSTIGVKNLVFFIIENWGLKNINQ